jgi:hypothetical protein
MWGLYRFATFCRPYYRPIGEPPTNEGPGVSNINETIDASVFDRWRADPSYRPPALRQWAASRKVDPEKITASVRADDPSAVVAG